MSRRSKAPSRSPALQSLYDALGGDRSWRVVEGCPCCVDPKDSAALASPPDGVDLDVLGRYAWKAMSTWGDSEDFRHFLPRILSLEFDMPSYSAADLGLILRKTADAGFEQWPDEQKRAVAGYLLAQAPRVFRCEVAKDARDFLRSVGTLVPLASFFAAWDADESDQATNNLAQSIEYELPDQKNDEVAVWLISAAHRERLERAFMERSLDRCASALELWEFFPDRGTLAP